MLAMCSAHTTVYSEDRIGQESFSRAIGDKSPVPGNSFFLSSSLPETEYVKGHIELIINHKRRINEFPWCRI